MQTLQNLVTPGFIYNPLNSNSSRLIRFTVSEQTIEYNKVDKQGKEKEKESE